MKKNKDGIRYRIFVFFLVLVASLVFCGAVSADDVVGGQPLTTDNGMSGTVSGGVYVDATPAPDWGNKTVTKTFTLPEGASDNIVEARLYVSAYCAHMQNDNAFTITNKFDGNGDGTYETTWSETGHGAYTYITDGGNDNSGSGGGTADPYLIINDHENRVTSDYLMWYNVTDLIASDTINVNVDTTGSSDGRIKMITLIAAYNDTDNDQIMYWVNQGHDVCSYYTEDNGEVAIGTTTFSTSDITGTVQSANLTVDYLASNNGYYGFPTTENNFDASSGYPGTGEFTNQNMDRTPDEQGAYSGVASWNVTDDVNNGENVTLGYARYLPGTGTSAFYKIALAILTVNLKAESVDPPVAAFTSNATSGTRPLAVQFTDQSTNNPTSWNWNFGDGTTSTDQNPTHTYNTAGKYTVSLTATNSGGSDDEVKTDYITAAPQVDLLVNGLVNTSPATAVFPGQNNTVTVSNIKNGGTDAATNILVYVYASDVNGGTTPVASTTIDSLAAGATTSLTLVDPTIRPVTADTVYGSSNISRITYTAVLDPLNTIIETNEANNNKTSALKSVLYNGYCGQGLYEYNGTDINTEYTYDLHGNIVYFTQPGTAYKGVGWTTRTETWTASDLSVPSTGTIEDVWLYLAYNWDYTADGNPNWTILFNGNDITNSALAWYTDQSNYGTYANYKYGLMVFNVTSMYNRDGDNNLVMTPLDGNLNALYPSTLAVVYSDPNETRKQIFINEQCDELGVSASSYGTTLEEATAYANFTGMTIDTGNVSSATLHSFAGSAGPDEGNLLFNGNTVALAAWQGTSSTASALVADVKNYLTATGNVAAIQGTTSGGMDTLQQFLVVEYVDAAPVAGFSVNSTSGDVPLAVQFTDASTGYVASYAWDFDNDGTIDSTEQNPTHTYSTPGTYTVKLTVTNSGGSDEEIKTNYISVIADSTAPAVISTNPVNGAVNVVRGKVITVVFSESVKAGSLWIELYNAVGTKVLVPITMSVSGNVLTINHAALLANGTKYILALHTGSVTDLVGNSLVGVASFFTTSSDVTAPSVVSADPVNGAVNVVRDKVITVVFSESVKAGSLWIELYNAVGTKVLVPITMSVSGNVLTINHAALLASGIKYTLALHTGSIVDLAGNSLAGVASFFTTCSDVTAPSVVSADPVNGAVNVVRDKVITVVFSESVKAGSLWIELYNAVGTKVLVPITMSVSGNVLTINHAALLASGIKYTLALHTGSIVDLAGNSLAGVASFFTTSSDVTAPAVVSTDPVNGAVNVVRDKVITVTFSEPIKAGNMWIELYNTVGTKALVPVTMSVSGNVLTINHAALLASGIKYTLALHTGSIVDLAGNSLAGVASFFTTCSDVTAPAVVSTDPVNGAVNVVRDKVITVAFSESVKAGSLWIELYNAVGTKVLVPVTMSVSGNVLTINHAALLANGTKYILALHTGSLTDNAENILMAVVRYFTTGNT